MSIDKPRQGDNAIIEVTPSMVHAGVCAFETLNGSADEFYLVEAVYKAMG